MAKCPTPDASLITASRGTTATGGMLIGGQEGAVLPGATVVAEDKNEKETDGVTAESDGSFEIKDQDLPNGFDRTVGNKLKITQQGSDCDKSDSAEVEIER